MSTSDNRSSGAGGGAEQTSLSRWERIRIEALRAAADLTVGEGIAISMKWAGEIESWILAADADARKRAGNAAAFDAVGRDAARQSASAVLYTAADQSASEAADIKATCQELASDVAEFGRNPYEEQMAWLLEYAGPFVPGDVPKTYDALVLAFYKRVASENNVQFPTDRGDRSPIVDDLDIEFPSGRVIRFDGFDWTPIEGLPGFILRGAPGKKFIAYAPGTWPPLESGK